MRESENLVEDSNIVHLVSFAKTVVILEISAFIQCESQVHFKKAGKNCPFLYFKSIEIIVSLHPCREMG